MPEIAYPPELPISARRDEIVAAIRARRVLIIAGDTGSGKTTQIPKMCLEAGQGRDRLIGCTQPRRIAALSVADRVGEELRAPDLVGYKIRFRDKTTSATRIKFMTDGVLLAETRKDRKLRRYDTIIIDEAHERSLNIDFLLGYLKTLLPERPDLKLIISSATLDTGRFSAHFGDAPVLRVSGRTWPIDYVYQPLEGPERDSYVEHAARAAVEMAEQQAGDMLIFMPTERDILDCVEILKGRFGGEAEVLPLFGRLQVADQRRIFRPARVRKVIVATNIAETSLTIPGIRIVIDTGLARISSYNPRSRTTSLLVSRISRASCDQRAGRCGRVGPGRCLRLYSEEDYENRLRFTRPEIQRANLAEVILRMIDLGLGDPGEFPFIDPPSTRAVRDGYRLLRELGAVTGAGRLTKRGRTMARLPLDPCVSRILIEAAELGCVREIKVIAAGLSIQDPRIRPADRENQADEAHKRFVDHSSDFLTLLNIWNSYQETAARVKSASRLRKFCRSHYLSRQRLREWQDIVDQINDLTRGDRKKRFRDNRKPASAAAVHQALLAGFLRNIGQRKEKNIYRVAGGREVMLFPGSALFNHGTPWIVCAGFLETSRLFAMNAANIDVRWLERIGGELCRRSWSEPHWEKRSGQVVALEKVTLFGLVIVAGRRVNYGRINRDTGREAREIFIRQALVPCELGGRFSFMRHNQALRRDLENMEARLRRRNILVDDETLYAFYDQRLGEVYDRHTLKAAIRAKTDDSFLRLSERDIIRDAPDPDELYRYPKTLRNGPCELRLRYRFEPGHAADGVSVDIPVPAVPDLNPALFEWLVPGLLPEKITQLLKHLPKSRRRALVPLPEAVDRIMDGMSLYEGSLYAALEKAIVKAFQLRIRRPDWRADSLPPHLRMRFRLIGEGGRVLLVSRSFRELLDFREPAGDVHAPATGGNRQKPDMDGLNLTTWEFEKGPGPEPVGGAGDSFLYPALYPDKSLARVTLRYIRDRREAEYLNRDGLRFLAALRCRAEVKALARECKGAVTSHFASWVSLAAGVSASKLREQLLSFILRELFDFSGEPLPGRAEFDEFVHAVRSRGLCRTGVGMLRHIHAILVSRREIVTALAGSGTKMSLPPEKIDEFRAHLDRLLPSDFLLTRCYAELEHVDRYLRGLLIRMERAALSPAKDSAKAARVRPFASGLARFRDSGNSSTACRRAWAGYRQMVEELYVSVFAPELGTAIKVSEKRLRQQWQEVESACHQVE